MQQYHRQDWNGKWTIAEGRTGYGTVYEGSLNLSPASKAGHILRWETGLGNFDGVGWAMGNSLIFAFGQSESFGLVHFKRQGEDLVNQFTTIQLGGEMGQERIHNCSGLGPDEKIWEMEGQMPGGAPYKGKFAAKKHGEIYLMTWEFEGKAGRLVGCAIPKDGEWVGVYGYDDDYTFGCGYFLPEGPDCLQGIFAMPAHTFTGTERIVRNGAEIVPSGQGNQVSDTTVEGGG